MLSMCVLSIQGGLTIASERVSEMHLLITTTV